MPIVDEGVDRKQLERGDAEPPEMIDYGGGRQPTEGAAPGGRYILALLRQPLDVRFIDDGVLPRDRRLALLAPGECFVDHDGLRHAARVVAPVEGQVGARAAGAIAEMRVAPDQTAREPLGVWIDQEFVEVEAESPLGLVGAMNAVAVELTRRDVVQIAMPDVVGALRQRDALDLAPAIVVEQAKFDLSSIG